MDLNRSSRKSLLNTTIPTYSQHGKPNFKSPRKKSKKKKVLISILIIVVLILGIGGYFGSKIISSIDKVFHGNIFSDVSGLFSNTTLKGENQGRINILLAGWQGTGSDEGALTDSIMVVSLDTKNNTAFTYSIPRDIWLNIPGMGHEKINAAATNSSFNQAGYFGGGMGQLQQILEEDFGIPIDYYALIDYNAFEDAVNAVGGITVDIQSPDPRGLYDPNVDKAHGGPLKLPNGLVHLNGLQALALALARGDSPYAYGFPLSDINRTQHQRQMLIALEQKALSTGVLTNPIRVTDLFSSLANNVTTDLSLPDALKLASLVKKVNLNNIKSYGLTYSGQSALLTTYVTSNGQDALIPAAGFDNFGQIKHYYLQITSSNPIIQENATVAILNASNISNLAHLEENKLDSAGFNVVYVGNTANYYNGNYILDNTPTKNSSSNAYLENLFKIQSSSSTSGSLEGYAASGYNADFVVIIGQNWANSN